LKKPVEFFHVKIVELKSFQRTQPGVFDRSRLWADGRLPVILKTMLESAKGLP